MNEYDEAEMLRRLRAADPASTLAEADPERVARLLEDAMTQTQSPKTHGSRRFLTAGLIAAALVLGGFALSLVLSNDDSPPVAGGADKGSPSSPADPSTTPKTGEALSTTTLELGDAAAVKCQVPNVRVLKNQDLAFEGTVAAIDGSQVTLDVKRWFRGDSVDQVIVRSASEQLLLALSGVEFETGSSYLVSATEGQVTLCGFSDLTNDKLAKLYEKAYDS